MLDTATEPGWKMPSSCYTLLRGMSFFSQALYCMMERLLLLTIKATDSEVACGASPYQA
jgi:hypothetical protein